MPETSVVKLTFTNPEVRKGKKTELFIECYEDWAPVSYKRFMTLVEKEFLDTQRVYRAVPNFVLDFCYGPASGSMSDKADAKLYKELSNFTPKNDDKAGDDKREPRKNMAGTICFGQEDDGTAKTEIFMNLNNNGEHLDKLGFWPFGKIIPSADKAEGTGAGESPTKYCKEAIVKLMSEKRINFVHGDCFFQDGAPKEKAMIRQNVLIAKGNEYIDKQYPKCTVLEKAEIVARNSK